MTLTFQIRKLIGFLSSDLLDIMYAFYYFLLSLPTKDSNPLPRLYRG